MNLWESKQKDNYTYFNDFDELISYLRENNIDLDYTITDEYSEGNEPRIFLDQIAQKQKINITYTDSLHQVAVPKKGNVLSNIIISSTFYNENKDKIIDYKSKEILDTLQEKEYKSVKITEDILSNDFFIKVITTCTSNKTISFEFDNEKKGLTEEQLKALKDNHIEAYQDINGKRSKVSTNKVIGFYTIKDLETINIITINTDISDEEISNFKYLKEDTIITFGQNNKLYKNELERFNKIKEIIKKIPKENRKYHIEIEVENRENLSQSGLLNECGENIDLIIENDLYNYKKKEYLSEEKKLNALVAPIKEADLSPLEKYIAVYDLVKKFKTYKENKDNLEESRYLRYILDNDYIVCVGFSKLLNTLLEKVGINSKCLSVAVDTSYDNGFTQDETLLDLSGHARNLVKIDDDKYDIHGIYIADATWDNNTKKDYYLNSLMTFNRNKEAHRLQNLTSTDLLLDFNSPEEFHDKLEYYLKNKVSRSYRKTQEEKIIDSYKSLYNDIMENLYPLDYEKYTEYFNKYSNIFTNYSIKIEELETTTNELLTDYYQYISKITNKKVDISKIFNAAVEVKRKIDKLPDKEIGNWLEGAKQTNQSVEKIVFPYSYDPKNYKNNYLSSEESTESKEQAKLEEDVKGRTR